MLTPNWLPAFTATIDAYLGTVPDSFLFEGKKYTPETFAKERVGINPNEYIEMVAYADQPLYQNTFMAVPDNWSFAHAYNIAMTDITKTIDNALKKGYTVAWAADVSERYFSWKNGVAFVPEKEVSEMTSDEITNLFVAPPTTERVITPEMRQRDFDNYQTTDDHAMHIVGLAKDQNGREYYIVKNSWGMRNDYSGYLYVTKAFVQFKTTALMLHKGGVPTEIIKNWNNLYVQKKRLFRYETASFFVLINCYLPACFSASAFIFSLGTIITFTRRFLARPSGVALSATGFSFPYHLVVKRLATNPLLVK